MGNVGVSGDRNPFFAQSAGCITITAMSSAKLNSEPIFGLVLVNRSGTLDHCGAYHLTGSRFTSTTTSDRETARVLFNMVG